LAHGVPVAVTNDDAESGRRADLTWNAQAIVTYRWTMAGYDVFAGSGYRALYWDYQDGGFEWDVTTSGPMLGGGVRF
jgi:hypothetical protein